MSEPAVRILLISGSGRDGSTNTAVRHTAAQLAPAGVTLPGTHECSLIGP